MSSSFDNPLAQHSQIQLNSSPTLWAFPRSAERGLIEASRRKQWLNNRSMVGYP